MKEESINTGNATTAAPDTISLPVPLEPPVIKRQPSHLSTSRGRRKKAFSSTNGLVCLDSVDLILIEKDQSCFSCSLNKSYSIKNVKESGKLLLKGLQDSNLFNLDGLNNVILRDTENLPVARICFKQKSCLYSSMALAVYAPCDVLVGTGEEVSGLFMFTSRLLLRNSDGDELFIVEYFNKVLSSYYQIKSANEDGGIVAKIIDKSRSKIRLQISTQMSLNSKLMLIGCCIGLANKFTPPNKPID